MKAMQAMFFLGLLTEPAYFNDSQSPAGSEGGHDHRPERAAHHQRADMGYDEMAKIYDNYFE
eukprot:13116225-Heterocapsa_arctica.AAC.1